MARLILVLCGVLVSGPVMAQSVTVAQPSTAVGLVVTPTETVTDGSKFSTPPIRLQATYDADYSPAVLPTTKAVDLTYTIAANGPNSYLAVRVDGGEPLRLFRDSGAKLTVPTLGTMALSLSAGSTGEAPTNWGFSLRDYDGDGIADLSFEDGTSRQSFHLESGTGRVNVLKGVYIRNNTPNGTTLQVDRVTGQTGDLVRMVSEGGQTLFAVSASGGLTSDGQTGMTGTCPASATLTIVGGLITACQ